MGGVILMAPLRNWYHTIVPGSLGGRVYRASLGAILVSSSLTIWKLGASIELPAPTVA